MLCVPNEQGKLTATGDVTVSYKEVFGYKGGHLKVVETIDSPVRNVIHPSGSNITLYINDQFDWSLVTPHIKSIRSLVIRTLNCPDPELVSKAEKISFFGVYPSVEFVINNIDKIAEMPMFLETYSEYCSIPGICNITIHIKCPYAGAKKILKNIPACCTKLDLNIERNDGDMTPIWSLISRFTKLKELSLIDDTSFDIPDNLPDTLEFLNTNLTSGINELIHKSFINTLVIARSILHVELEDMEENRSLTTVSGLFIRGDNGNKNLKRILNRNKFGFRASRVKPIINTDT